MRQLEATPRKVCSKVKAAFQHPTHSLTLLHREDNFLYLYDEKVMSQTSISVSPFPQKIIHAVFSSSYGGVYLYYFSKSALSNFAHCPHLAILAINEQAKIQIRREVVTEKGKPLSSSCVCMGLLEAHHPQRQSALICMQHSSFSLVSTQGQVLRSQKLVCDGRLICKSKSYWLSNREFIIAENKILMKAAIHYDSHQVTLQVELELEILNVFVDLSSGRRYMAVLTQDYSIKLINICSQPYKICHSLLVPSLFPTHLCFFHPAANTSCTNKFKDRMYLVFSGISTVRDYERHLQRQSSKYLEHRGGKSGCLNTRNLYCYEFRQACLNSSGEVTKLKQSSMFYIQEVGPIEGLLFNECESNCVRAVNEKRQLLSYDLALVLGSQRVDEEWIYDAYRFEQCPSSRSFYYQEGEGEFENIPKSRQISQQQLDDWSFSSLKLDQMRALKNRRAANLLLF